MSDPEDPDPRARVTARDSPFRPPADDAAGPACAVPCREPFRMPDRDTIHLMIAEAAYYLAERRAFAPGHEEQDWLAAKVQIAAQIREVTKPPREPDR